MLEDEGVTDEEETFIQSFIQDEAEVPVSTLYSSAKDLYASVVYTDLSDEMKLVTDLKCFTYYWTASTASRKEMPSHGVWRRH